MDTETDQDITQLATIKERVLLFQQGRLPLHALVVELETLLHSLRAVPHSLAEELDGHWGSLEITNAVLLERSVVWIKGRTQVDPDIERQVDDVLQSLIAACEARLVNK